jgi:hypothetical protein
MSENAELKKNKEREITKDESITVAAPKISKKILPGFSPSNEKKALYYRIIKIDIFYFFISLEK